MNKIIDEKDAQDFATTTSGDTIQEISKPRRPRGFAAMSREKVSAIASKGGKAAHAAGTAHQFNSDEARIAGQKGGVAPHIRRGRGKKIDSVETLRNEHNETIPANKVA